VGTDKWIEFLQESKLNLVGIHADTKHEPLPELRAFLTSVEGKKFLQDCYDRGIDVEYEVHALQDLLPRTLFEQHSNFFRMDSKGVRQKEFNMCFTSEGAYEEIERMVREVCQWMTPSTHRYFFWTDDVQNSFCHCENCRSYSESEQALLFENRLLRILRSIDEQAVLAHLAYHQTLPAPQKVVPDAGIFLEYAPINRNYEDALSVEHLKSLNDNLDVFKASTAHILEYWIDASMFSRWNKNRLVKIPWNREYCKRDVDTYRSLGIGSVTSFGAWINSSYIDQFGEAHSGRLLREYGEVLKGI